jgi:hypothetical protein
MKRWIVALLGWVNMNRPHLSGRSTSGFDSTPCRNASMGTNIRTSAHVPPPRPMTTASCHNPELSTRLPPLDPKRNHVPRPCSNLCLIIDLAGKSRAPTSVAQAKLFVEILGNHYPERLGSVSRGLLFVHVDRNELGVNRVINWLINYDFVIFSALLSDPWIWVLSWSRR